MEVGDLIELTTGLYLVVEEDATGQLRLVRGDDREEWMGKTLPPNVTRIPGEMTEIRPDEIAWNNWVLLDGTWRRVMHVSRSPRQHRGAPELFLYRPGLPRRHVMTEPLKGCRPTAAY